MKVFIISSGYPYEGEQVEEVYFSLEKAQQSLENHKQTEQGQFNANYYLDEYEVIE